MNEKTLINDDNVARVRDLLECMELGNENGVREILDDLTDIREASLYQEVGKLTRELHDAIGAFGMDDRISNLAEHDIPDARERLSYVITKTDDAANRTLTAVEASIPLCDESESQAAELSERWNRFTAKQLSADEFRALAKDVNAFFDTITSSAQSVKTNLNEVLMAQDFQDLTGQIIKKVITLVDEVEGNLVNLVKLAGLPEPESKLSAKEDEYLAGPVVPGVDTGDVVSGQDEVDDLLSSLGF